MSDGAVEITREHARLIQVALDQWCLDYADPDDGNWPERQEYLEAISAFRAAVEGNGRVLFSIPLPGAADALERAARLI